MTVERHACADGLTPECFKKYPDWAKMRFAQKLMHTLFPAEITKRLPQIVLDAFAQMPPDWPAGEALPEALSLTPPAGLMPPPGGAIAPLYTAPFSAGPPNVPGGNKAPAETEPWLYDKFTTLDLTFWTENNTGAATNTIDTGRLKQTSPAGTAAQITSAEDATIPAAFDWTFDLTFESGSGIFRVEVFTGTHRLWMDFILPTTVRLFTGPFSYTDFTATDFTGVTDSWALAWDGSTCTLTQDAVEIFAGQTPYVDATLPGVVKIQTAEAVTYLDELKIQET